jgi:hypothetical protein
MKDWKLLPVFVLGVLVGAVALRWADHRYVIHTHPALIVKLDTRTGQSWAWQGSYGNGVWREIKTAEHQESSPKPVLSDEDVGLVRKTDIFDILEAKSKPVVSTNRPASPPVPSRPNR